MLFYLLPQCWYLRLPGQTLFVAPGSSLFSPLNYTTIQDSFNIYAHVSSSLVSQFTAFLTVSHLHVNLLQPTIPMVITWNQSLLRITQHSKYKLYHNFHQAVSHCYAYTSFPKFMISFFIPFFFFLLSLSPTLSDSQSPKPSLLIPLDH